MFCGECGEKLKKGDLFCEKCGTKVESIKEVKKTSKKSVSKNSNLQKPMDKKTKIIIAIVAVIAVVLFVIYQFLSNIYSPKEIVKDYIEALINKDASKLYSYIEIDGDKTFVSKKAFEKLLDDKEYLVDIENYTITDVIYAEGKLSASVKVSYTTKSSSSENTETISLVKAKDKKLIFFDDWKIADLVSGSMIVEDYKITVPKDATITFAGIKVDKKFIDKDESTDLLDVYILPQVFDATVKLTAKLANGIELSDNVTPSSYYDDYKLSFNLENLSNDTKTKLTEVFTNNLKGIYQSGIERKTWDDIKNSYTKDSVDTDSWQEVYTEFVRDLEDSTNKLKAIEFTKVELSSVSLDDDGNLVIRAKVNYKYTIEYTSYDGDVTTKDSRNYSNITLTYQINGEEYSLVNARSLVTYFSRY